jgi:peptide/nickel transport system permease protein
MGRDLLARLLYGGRVSLGIGLSAMLGAIMLGTFLGAVAGFWGGALDAVIMRVTDAMLSFPLFFFLLTVLSLIGSSIPNLIIVIALTSWMNVARLVRAEVLKVKVQQFVEAARAVGNTNWRILLRHILPHTVPSIIVAATLGVANAILTESALSYLGLGVKPPDPSWGNMLSSARSYIWNASHLVLYPGLAIFGTVLLFNAMGDGLRDALDPTASGR